MGRHTLQHNRARQWSCAPLPKVHLGRRWAAGVAGGVGVLSVAFWGSDPAVVPALPLAGDVSTGSTEHPELLPSVGTGLRVATGLDQMLNAAVLPAPELLKMALAKPLPSVTIDVHSVPESVPALPGYGSPAPVVRPPCPDPVQHPGAHRAWWLKWFPHTTPPVVTPPPAPEPAPVEEPDPLPAPSSPAQPPPAVEEVVSVPEPVHEPEPTSAPEPESSSADDSGPAETASTESAPETKSSDSSSEKSSDSEKSSEGSSESSDSSSSEDSSDSSDHDSDSGDSSGSDSDKDSS